MSENYTRERELLDRYRKGLCSQEEKLRVDHWFNEQSKSFPDNLSRSDDDEIRKEIWAKLPASNKAKLYKLWFRISTAAAAILVIGIGIFYYSSKKPDINKDDVHVQFSNDIAPGKIGATLTLANGTKINLNRAANGELAKEAGAIITKTANGQLIYKIEDSANDANRINKLSTARGETYTLRLPDGSLVWLNAASSLTYSTALNDHGIRKVTLDGEGYFEITKDKMHPFVVESKGQQVEVLGTHFNINAYAEELSPKTTLLEGAIKIKYKSIDKILKPGEQATLTSTDIVVGSADIEEAMAWKNGKIIFNNETLGSIMRKVSRWYNVEVRFQDGVENITYQGVVSRTKKISSILNFFRNTETINYRIKDNTITLTKK